MPVSALVLGCAGVSLGADERAFFRDADPWGFILFRRNIGTPAEVAALTAALREAVGRDAPVLVDQEGGRVQRLGPPHWPRYPAPLAFGALAGGLPAARETVRLAGRLIAHDLRAVGITVDCAPVLDLPVQGSNDAVLGDRAYGADVAAVATLGRAMAEGLMAGAVLPVIKHIPGHGRSMVDSHYALPRVEAPLDVLAAADFLPFRMLADMPAAMTAHLVYAAVDPDAPCTTSRRAIRALVRGAIGFDGLLFSDDLSMQALSGSLGERAAAAFSAGCDIGLHCNGTMAEMVQVAAAAPRLGGKPRRRAEAALARIAHLPEPFDEQDARRRLADAVPPRAAA